MRNTELQYLILPKTSTNLTVIYSKLMIERKIPYQKQF